MQSVAGWPGLHVGELRLAKIGGDPDVERHDQHQRLPGRRVGAFGGGELR